MCSCTRSFRVLSIFLVALLISPGVIAADGIRLYTPYTNISVPPGETIDYNIDIRNDSKEPKNVDLAVSRLPRDWNATLKAGGYIIRRISILPGQSKTVSLNVVVPLKVNKGNHTIHLEAKDFDLLPLVVNVSEQGTLRTEFTCDQVNMEGHTGSNFTFTTKLLNRTGEKQMYSLRANPPRGWTVDFKPNYKQATAVELETEKTSSISIDIKPPYNVGAGTYEIPVQAINQSTSAALKLEVVITGTYKMELSTPTGLLSAKLTAGKEKRIELLVKNTGSSELHNVMFRASKPKDWDVKFSPDTIRSLQAGRDAQIFAIVTAEDRAIPGDYATTVTARTPEAESSASFRISVKTPLLWGWLGILIIAGTLSVIYYLFRKYGRR